MKTKRIKETTVGVRFPGSAKVYTYKVPAKHDIRLGDRVMVDSPWGGPVAFVVRIDKRPRIPLTYTMESLSRIVGKLVVLYGDD